jgi:hypothetical protein
LILQYINCVHVVFILSVSLLYSQMMDLTLPKHVVFINNKTNISCSGLNLSPFKCQNCNGVGNIKIKYFIHATGCVQRIWCCLTNWLWERISLVCCLRSEGVGSLVSRLSINPFVKEGIGGIDTNCRYCGNYF